jgi:hypothetical protein
MNKIVLALVLLMACVTPVSAQTVSVEDRAACTLAKPAPNIPTPFGLFTVLSKNTERKDFCKLSRWYSESNGTQVFRLFKGDNFADNVPGGRRHARTEAQGPSFAAGSTWHTFEATMKPSRTLVGENMTIAQLFAGCCGPQLRIELKPNGRVHMGSRSNGNFRISDDKDYANKSFKLKIWTNGETFEVYFNGVKKFTGKTEESKNGNKAARYHFRWGVYAGVPKFDYSNTVTDIRKD